MMNWNKILKEWSYRVGVIKSKDEKHLHQLTEILKEEGWSYNVIEELINNLKDTNLIYEMSQRQMGDTLVSASSGKLGPHSTPGRVSNLDNISSSDFITIIKSAFGVTKVDIDDPKTGSNNSGAFKLFHWTYEGKAYKCHLAGAVTGRGTAATKDQETSWLLVLSGMQYGGDATDKESFISLLISNSAVYSKVDGITSDTALKLAAYLENNDDWYKSHVAQCKKIMSSLGINNQPTKYVKDASNLPVNIQAKKLYKEEHGKKLDLDKWNPADVWLEYSSVPQFDKLTKLNNYLLDSIENGNGYIGVSLKKGKGGVGLINGKEKKVYTVSNISLKYGKLFSQGVTFDYSGLNLDGLSLNFRIFQGKPTETIRGEGISKGADAVQGKVAMGVIDDFKSGTLAKIEAVKGVSVQYDKKNKTWGWDSKGNSRFTKVQTAYSNIKSSKKIGTHGSWDNAFNSSDKFIEVLNEYQAKYKPKENSVKAAISSRFQTIVLGSIISKLSKTEKEKVMLGLLKYGKSESDWSSAHYKAQ